MLHRAATLIRDWRISTLVPVIIIHLIVFAVLYAVGMRFAENQVINTRQFGAAVLLDDLEFNFEDVMVTHGWASWRDRLIKQGQAHELASLNVYDSTGRSIISTSGGPSPVESAQASAAFQMSEYTTVWSKHDNGGAHLLAVRLLNNAAACQTCHGIQNSRLGAIQMSVDLTAAIRESHVRMRRNLAWLGLAWIVLLGMTFWIRGVVIGRPLQEMRRSLAAAGTSATTSEGHDLGALATRLDQILWDLIEGQRKREQNIARQMVRAEQLAALGEIAAGLTHEIKNPLAGLTAALELLNSEAEENSPSREVYDQMLRELRRVNSTLESLLRLARPRPPQRLPIDMAKMAREVESLFSARLRRQGISLRLEIPSPVPILDLDPALMIQLLVNLVTNSMQATDRGGEVNIFLAPFPRADGLVLAVSDTGRGIPAENLDRIFDPFFTTKEEGTGLGLAICRQIVEEHGGTISVESVVNKGTRVVVLLPRVAAEAEEENDQVAFG